MEGCRPRIGCLPGDGTFGEHFEGVWMAGRVDRSTARGLWGARMRNLNMGMNEAWLLEVGSGISRGVVCGLGGVWPFGTHRQMVCVLCVSFTTTTWEL